MPVIHSYFDRGHAEHSSDTNIDSIYNFITQKKIVESERLRLERHFLRFCLFAQWLLWVTKNLKNA